MNGRGPDTEPPEARREADSTQLRVLQRTTERIAVVVNKSRARIERIAEEVNQLLYDAKAEGIEQPEARQASEQAKTATPSSQRQRARPRTTCHGCPATPGTPADVRIVTEGCRRGVPYCTQCARNASRVLEQQRTPYETATIGT